MSSLVSKLTYPIHSLFTHVHINIDVDCYSIKEDKDDISLHIYKRYRLSLLPTIILTALGL